MIGEGIDRVDGRAKAQGAVVYSGDLVLEGMVHAALVQSPISNGRIVALDAARATSVAGVLAVLHHGNAPRLAPRGAGEMPLLLQDDRINYGGQPIAAVIAETLAAARRAAGLVEARCESRPSVSILRRDAPDLFAPAAVLGEPPDSVRGDPARALGRSRGPAGSDLHGADAAPQSDRAPRGAGLVGGRPAHALRVPAGRAGLPRRARALVRPASPIPSAWSRASSAAASGPRGGAGGRA